MPRLHFGKKKKKTAASQLVNRPNSRTVNVNRTMTTHIKTNNGMSIVQQWREDKWTEPVLVYDAFGLPSNAP